MAQIGSAALPFGVHAIGKGSVTRTYLEPSLPLGAVAGLPAFDSTGRRTADLVAETRSRRRAMELFGKLFGNLLALVYHCFDRLVLQGYLPLLT